MTAFGKAGVLGTGCLVALFLMGCATASKLSYDIPTVRASSRQEGERYCVIEVRGVAMEQEQEFRFPTAEEVQPRLESRYPAMFSSGPEAIPILVDSRIEDMHLVGGYVLPSCLLAPVTFCTLGLVPALSDVSRMEFVTELELASDKTTPGVRYGATQWTVFGSDPVVRCFFTARGGWRVSGINLESDDEKTRVQRGVNQASDGHLDAFCASIARAVQCLLPEERAALRDNNKAWWLDARRGNKRNRDSRPVALVHATPAAPPVPPVEASSRPRIVSQAWNAATRRGTLLLDLSTFPHRDAAVAWARDEYLPEYCQTLGVSVAADDPTTTSRAAMKLKATDLPEKGLLRIDFLVAE